VQAFKSVVAAHAATVEELAAADRALDRGFRTAIASHAADELGLAPLEPGVLRELGALFRKRAPGGAAAAVAAPSPGAPSAADEAAEAAAARAARDAFTRPLGAADLPDGYDTLLREPFWPRFAALRAAKVEAELALADAQRGAAALDAHAALLAGALARARAAVDAAQAARGRIVAARDIGVNDVELLVRLRTGQVEAGARLAGGADAADAPPHPLGGAADPDYADASLLPADAVEGANNALRARGADKVASLAAIRDARKALLLLSWETETARATIASEEALAKDLQLLQAVGVRAGEGRGREGWRARPSARAPLPSR